MHFQFLNPAARPRFSARAPQLQLTSNPPLISNNIRPEHSPRDCHPGPFINDGLLIKGGLIRLPLHSPWDPPNPPPPAAAQSYQTCNLAKSLAELARQVRDAGISCPHPELPSLGGCLRRIEVVQKNHPVTTVPPGGEVTGCFFFAKKSDWPPPSRRNGMVVASWYYFFGGEGEDPPP